VDHQEAGFGRESIHHDDVAPSSLMLQRLPDEVRWRTPMDSVRCSPMLMTTLARDESPARFKVHLGEAMTFTRITTRPDVCTGKPCIRDLRFPVSRLLGLLASGQSREEILRAYPYLEAADLDEALRYAASLAEDETIELSG
jgi:uncharacterized protein (DUF433 family)